MAYTADDLLTAVKRRAMVPDTNAALSSTDILALADEEISTVLMPTLRVAREDFYTATEDQAIVSGTSDYRIPRRAQGATLRDVLLVDESGEGVSLPRIPLEELERFKSASSGWWSRGVGFCIKGDVVTLLPTPTQNGYSLRLRYYRRPSRLVQESAARRISALSGTTTQTLTVTATVPGTWTASNDFDIVEGFPNFDLVIGDLDASTVSGTSLVFSNQNIPSRVGVTPKAGYVYWVALADETPIVQLPVELHPVLITAVAFRVQDIVGDRDGAAVSRDQLMRQMKEVRPLIEPRVDGESPRIVNRSSPLRGNRYRIG